MSIKSKKDKNKEVEIDILDTIFQRLEKNKQNVSKDSSENVDSDKIKEKYKSSFDDLFGYENESEKEDKNLESNFEGFKKNKEKDIDAEKEINNSLNLLFSSNSLDDNFVNKNEEKEDKIEKIVEDKKSDDDKPASISDIKLSEDEIKKDELFEKNSEETLNEFDEAENTISNLKISDISEAANKLFFTTDKSNDSESFLDKIPDDDSDVSYDSDIEAKFDLDETDDDLDNDSEENNEDSSDDNFSYSSIESEIVEKQSIEDIVKTDNEEYSDDDLNYDYDQLEKELNENNDESDDDEKAGYDDSEEDDNSDEDDSEEDDNSDEDNYEDDDDNLDDDDSEDDIELDKKEEVKDEKLKAMFDETEDFDNPSNKIKTSGGEKFVSILIFLLGLGFLVYSVLFTGDQANNLYIIINASIVFLFTIFNLIKSFSTKVSARKGLNIVASLFIFIFLLFNILVTTKIIKIPTQELLKDFTNVKITEALKWAKERNIDVYQKYEYSDNIEEYHIISQDLPTTTLLKKVHEITFTVSSGPNYEKTVSIPNMVGWNIDTALKTINENFLNNVIIDYEISNDIAKDTIISQSISGQMRRNEELKIVVSIGKEEDLVPVKMIDLKGKKLFDATLWLKRNGFKYELFYVFSDDFVKDTVVGFEADIGKTYDPKKDTIKLIVSKGKSIVVPDLTKMSMEEITEWITENNLKVEFETEYNSTVEKGKVIKASHKEKDEIESGALIKVTTSLGPLKMPKIKTLDEFRNWATEHKINFQENFEFNKDVKNGDVIRTVPGEGAVVNYTDTVNIYISYGAAVSVPNFVGRGKSDIENECRNVGLNCTFYYNDYSDTPRDVAQNQNKVAGAEVVSGTYVNIGLSSGPAPAPDPTPTPQPDPTPTPDPTPVCDVNDLTQPIYVVAGNTYNETKEFVEKIGRDYNVKWNIVSVSKCDNGDSPSGGICNGDQYRGVQLNHCDTYTVILVED